MAKLQHGTALVTGANRGIGLAIAREFGKEGAMVLLARRKDMKVIKTLVTKADIAEPDERSNPALLLALR